jgi:hypothetical protein
MLIKKISFPSPLKYTEDIYDDNFHVFVELEDGFEYTVVVGTPKKRFMLMQNMMMPIG